MSDCQTDLKSRETTSTSGMVPEWVERTLLKWKGFWVVSDHPSSGDSGAESRQRVASAPPRLRRGVAMSLEDQFQHCMTFVSSRMEEDSSGNLIRVETRRDPETGRKIERRTPIPGGWEPAVSSFRRVVTR